MSRLIFAIVAVCAFTDAGVSQAPSQTPLTFEVASVKVNNSGETTAYGSVPPSGRIALTNMQLRLIIIQAFRVNPQLARYTLIGGSERILTTRFDINAKPPDDAPPDQAYAMLRALLSDRFQLQTHTETRDIPVYSLRMATAGRLGPKFRASNHDCVAFANARREGRNAVEPADANGRSWCRSNPFGSDGIELHQAGPITQLIRDVQGFADRPIVDKTGLDGNYEWEMKFVPSGVSTTNVPNLFTAFREELGLKLEPEIAPSEVLVVDRVEMPTPD